MKINRTVVLAGVIYYSYDLLFDLYKKNRVSLPNHLKTYGPGSYALVTGATDGIGKKFAEVLAEQGFNLVLISRSKPNLDLVAGELHEKYNVNAKVFPMDLTTAGKSEYQGLEELTRSCEVSIVVNNAGVMNITPTVNVQSRHIDSSINIHCLAVARIMKIFMPRFKLREKRSAVINVSSSVALRPYPVLTIYSATKAFNYYLTAGMHDEVHDKVDVMSYISGPVLTRMLINPNNPLAIPTDEAVIECLKDLGIKRISYGHWKHTLVAYIIELLPQFIRLKLFGFMTRSDLGLSSFPGF